eukprot:COSAG01_NODE_16687_length_1214_cov_228.381166_2_plen_323_part_01
MTLDPHRQIVYFFVQHLNKYGYGYVVSMDVSNADNVPLSHCTPKVELYIQGAAINNTRNVRGGWIDLQVDCEGVLWMSNLVHIWKYDPMTMYSGGLDTRISVVSTAQFGCQNTMTLTNCQIRGIAIDDSVTPAKIYYSYLATTSHGTTPNTMGMIATQVRSVNKDGSADTLVYRAIYYERSGSGPWDASYFGSFTLDLVNRDFYVSTYKGNSEERSILRLTMDPPSLGQMVYLYGHPSIPHSMIMQNRFQPYQGPDQYTPNGPYEVVVPKYGMTRYYAGSVPIAVVPGQSLRQVVSNPLANFFDRVDGKPTVAGCSDNYPTSA